MAALFSGIVIAGLMVFGLGLPAFGQTSSSQKVKITNLSAKLFYDTDGSFSDDVFSGNVNLWNTVLEGASREGSSSSMLVVIEIEAYDDGHLRKRNRVELTAKYRIENGTLHGRSAYFAKIVPADIRSSGKAHVGFWLYETGCHPLELRARIVGQRNTVTKKINFGCGE